jgi:hypothetical protein
MSPEVERNSLSRKQQQRFALLSFLFSFQGISPVVSLTIEYGL